MAQAGICQVMRVAEQLLKSHTYNPTNTSNVDFEKAHDRAELEMVQKRLPFSTQNAADGHRLKNDKRYVGDRGPTLI